MIKNIACYFREKTGSVLPLTAIMLPLILGATGFGVDVGIWVMHGRDLQSAADAAAIAGAWEIVNDSDDSAEAAALKEAINNGYTDAAGNEFDLEIEENESGSTIVTANLSQKDQIYFSKMVFGGEIFVSVAAASAIILPPSDFCILSLDEEADGALTTNGNVTIDSGSCGFAINSDSDTALDLGGNSDVTVGSVTVVGDYQTGNSVEFEATSVSTNASTTPDPYGDLEVPDYGGCDHNNFSVTGNGTLNPGVYCGGLTIKGNGNVTMNPGVYIIKNGDFKVTGNGTLTAENVSIVLTADNPTKYGNLEVSGGKNMTFTAPEEGEEMAGVSFYQDREAPASNQCSSLLGNAALDVWGAIYFPSRCLNIGGNSDSSAHQGETCTRIIASTITFHGNPNIGNDCEGTAVEDIGQYNVRLVL